MEISCGNCGRHFEIDEDIASRAPAAQCVCGARLNLAAYLNSPAQRLGKYILQHRIAVGGMGEIFYGKIAGIEGFEREVAIKKMLPHLSADRSFIDMMVKEAKLTVLLNHPNIVQVFDLSREGSEYYIAMEYVPGTNVGQMLEVCHKKRIYLPTEVAVYITMQVLRGLGYAHELKGPDGEPMNILHRDITPQNILVTQSAWVKIADFGIAKARNEISTTSPGMIKGKLGYIAPEQMRGESATQSVDIFCAGILLWESLATRRLFKGTDEIDTFRLISECKIPSLTQLRDDVTEALQSVVNTALGATPEKRYATADAFYDALNQAIFPRTVDDLAAAAKRYFGEHAEFFEKVITADSPALDDGQTMQIDTPSVLTGDLPRIVDVLPRPSTEIPQLPARRTPWIAIVAALLLLVGGVGTWLYYAPQPTSEAAPGPVHLTQEELQLAVSAERPRLLECYRKGNRAFFALEDLKGSITVASTGGVAEVTLEAPDTVNAPVRQCIRDVLSALRFRRHPEPRFDAKVALPEPTLGKAKPETPSKPTRATAQAAKPLTNAEITLGVQKRHGALAACFRLYDKSNTNPPAKLDATMTINTRGRVSSASVKPTPPDNIGQCLRKALTAIRYHRIPKPIEVTFPLSVKSRIR